MLNAFAHGPHHGSLPTLVVFKGMVDEEAVQIAVAKVPVANVVRQLYDWATDAGKEKRVRRNCIFDKNQTLWYLLLTGRESSCPCAA